MPSTLSCADCKDTTFFRGVLYFRKDFHVCFHLHSASSCSLTQQRASSLALCDYGTTHSGPASIRPRHRLAFLHKKGLLPDALQLWKKSLWACPNLTSRLSCFLCERTCFLLVGILDAWKISWNICLHLPIIWLSGSGKDLFSWHMMYLRF